MRLLVAALITSLVLAALPAPGARAQEAASAAEPRSAELELALEEAYYGFDHPGLLAILRSTTTAVFESYCGISNLIPPPEGYETLDLVLGVGCLVGAGTLFWLSARRMSDFGDTSEARGRLDRFREAAADGVQPAELQRFELELEEAANSDRLHRWLGIGLGIGALVASGVLATLVATEHVDPTAGVTIATATGVVGIIGLIGLLVEGPSEAALANCRARVEASAD